MNKAISALFLLTILSLVSCGQSNSLSTPSKLGSSAVIIGDLNWSEVSSLDSSSSIRINSKFVADVRIPAAQARCTGFMISEDYLMTNQHCITSASDAVGVTAIFNHEEGVRESSWDEVRCDKLITNDIVLDFAILRCEGKPGKRYGYAQFSGRTPLHGDSLYVIHQNCDHETFPGCDFTKKVSGGKIIGLDLEILHDADTLGGSSGSPVFNESHELIGLHHGGMTSQSTGEGVANLAVYAFEIKEYLQKYFPEILEPSIVTTWVDIGDNNSFKKANFVSLEEAAAGFQGQIEKKRDRDYYKFNITESGRYQISLYFKHYIGDLDLKLFNSKRRKLEKSCSKTSNEIITANLSPGEYTIKVDAKGRDQSPYSVQIQRL